MSAGERQKRRRQKLRMSKGGHSLAETPEVSLEDLARTFYDLYWRGRRCATRPLADGVGDWDDEEEREYWRGEAKRLVAKQPLEILTQDDEVA